MDNLQLYKDLSLELFALRNTTANIPKEEDPLLDEMEMLKASLSIEEQVEADHFMQEQIALIPPFQSSGLLAIESLFNNVFGDPAWCLAMEEKPARWPGGDPACLDLAIGFEWDLRGWAAHFFPELCAKKFSTMHDDFFNRHLQRRGMRGWKDATAAPRGNGKTTIKGKLEIIHDIVYQHEKYIIIGSANAALAEDKVKDIRVALEENVELRRVYGRMETKDWRKADFVTANAVYVRAFTPKTKIRGFNWKGNRPSKIVLDDAEDPESMLTQLRRSRFSEWLWNDVMKLGNNETNVDVIGTILHPESLLSELLKNPGFERTKYQAVLAFADGPGVCELWSEWRSIVVDLSRPNRLTDARAFFEDHEADMLQGSRVLWPEHENYYQLMLGRVIEGESSFWQERMNEPIADSRYIFDLETAGYCRILPDGILRHDGTKVSFVDILDLAAYWDPTPPKKEEVGTDFASCVVGFKDQHGYIYAVDAYLAQEMSTHNQVQGIVDLLWKWRVPLLGMEANGFQSLLGKDIREAILQRSQEEGEPWQCHIQPIVNSKNKMARIRSLEPMVANAWLQFARNLPHEAYRQIAEFIPVDGAGHDDFPDSLEGMVRTINGLWDRKSF